MSERNWQRTIIFTPGADSGQQPVRGQLVGCADDQATAFIRISPTPKRTKVIAVPTARCHFARQGDATAVRLAGSTSAGDY